MNDYSFYIENYFINNHFKNMKMDGAVRNYALEAKIKNAAKVEHALKTLLYDKQLDRIIPLTGRTFGGISYEVPTTMPGYIVKYDNNSTKDKELFELFGIENHRFRYPAPLLDLYCKAHGVGINSAVVKLMKILQEKGLFDNKIEYATQYLMQSLPKATVYYDIIHEYEEPFQAVSCSYFVKYFKREKIIIPFRYTIDSSFPILFYYQLTGDNIRFYNEAFIHSNPNAIIILTDSIELAARNQAYISQIGIDDIVWISFDTKTMDISLLNWSLLRKRIVFYVLKEHSGFGTKHIFDTLSEVKNYTKTKILYISFLTDFSGREMPMSFAQYPPIILTDKQLSVKRNNLYTVHNIEEFKNNLQNVNINDNPILTPLIYSKSTNLLYGRKSCDKKLFALHLAFSISQSASAFKGWKAESSTPVLYLSEAKKLLSFKQAITDAVKILKCCDETEVPELQIEPFDIPKPITLPNNEILPNFYWNIYDNSTHSINILEYKIIEFIEFQTKKIEEQTKGCKVLFIDDLFDGISKENFIDIIGILRNLIESLKKSNWTIIIVADAKNFYTSKIYFDNILKISEKKTEEDYCININVEKACKRINANSRNFTCEAILTSGAPKFVKKNQSREKWNDSLLLPRDKLINKIAVLTRNGFTIKAISEKLEISESLVKKLKPKKYRFKKTKNMGKDL